MTNVFDGLALLHTRNYDTQVCLDGDMLKVAGSVRARRLAELDRSPDEWSMAARG